MTPTDAPRLPLHPPAWNTLRVATTALLSLAGAVASWPAVSLYEHPPGRNIGIPLSLSTALCTVLHCRFALRGDTPGRTALRSTFGAILFGALNAGLTFFVASLVDGRHAPGDLLKSFGFALVSIAVGFIFALPFSLGYGALFALPLRLLARGRPRPPVDGAESVASSVGAVLAVFGTFAAWGHGEPWRTTGGALVLLGAALLTLSLVRDALRLSWLRRLRRGLVADWVLRPAAPETSLRHVVALFGSEDESRLTWVIEPAERPEGAPFRDAPTAQRVPAACVAPEGSLAGSYMTRRMVLAAVALLLALAGGAVSVTRPTSLPASYEP